MRGIPREVAEHSLEIRPGSKPVKQRLRRFDEKRQITGEEVHKLHDETYEAKVDTPSNSLSTLTIPSSEPQKEEIPPRDSKLDIEFDLFADLGNISNYHFIDRCNTPVLWLHQACA